MDDRDIDNGDNGLESEGELHDAADTGVDLEQDTDIEEDEPVDFEALSEDEMDDLVDDGDEEGDFDANIVDAELELSPKEQNARALAIRRAIEERAEKRLLEESLEELDMDLDDF